MGQYSSALATTDHQVSYTNQPPSVAENTRGADYKTAALPLSYAGAKQIVPLRGD